MANFTSWKRRIVLEESDWEHHCGHLIDPLTSISNPHASPYDGSLHSGGWEHRATSDCRSICEQRTDSATDGTREEHGAATKARALPSCFSTAMGLRISSDASGPLQTAETKPATNSLVTMLLPTSASSHAKTPSGHRHHDRRHLCPDDCTDWSSMQMDADLSWHAVAATFSSCQPCSYHPHHHHHPWWLSLHH